MVIMRREPTQPAKGEVDILQTIDGKMTSPAIPAFPAHIPFAVLPSNPPALLAPQNPVAHSAFQMAVSPGALRNCIRLRGMPYSATIDDIVAFLGDYSSYILPSGVHIVLNQQGRPSGDAFIQLTSVEKASQAGLDVSKGGCHKKHMGERYVEVFQCSGDEMNMVLMGGTLNRNGIAPPPGMTLVTADTTPSGLIQTSPISNHSASIPSPIILQAPHGQLVLQHPIVASPAASNFQSIDLVQTQALLSASRAAIYPQPTLLPYPHYLPTPPVSPGNPAPAISLTSLPGVPSVSTSALITQEENGAVSGSKFQLRMQNLPFSVTVSEILEFFKEFTLEQNAIKLLYNDKLHPTGEALVTFTSLRDVHRALLERNRKLIGNRIIDLILS